MSGFLTSLVWRGAYPAVAIYGEETIDLDKTGARAVLARMADNCSDAGDLLMRIGRNLIAEDVRLSVERVKKIQAAWVKLGVLRPIEDEGGRGRFVYYEIDVDRLVAFIEDKRLPKAWRRSEQKLSPDNRVAHDPVSKPGRREAETGSPDAETGSPRGDKPGRGRPPSDKPVEQTLDEARARGDAAPDGASPRGGEGPDREGGQSTNREGGQSTNRDGGAGAETPSDAANGQEALERDADPPTRAAMTPGERRRLHHQNFILDWLLGEEPFPLTRREVGFPERLVGREGEIEAFALAMPATYLKGVAGLVRWAESALAGDATQRTPIASVKALMAALADPVRRALMARRLACLRAAAEAARDDSDPQADDRGAGKAA